MQAAELRQPYESSLAGASQAGPELLAAYMAYIKVEERQGDPARVQAGWVTGTGGMGWGIGAVGHADCSPSQLSSGVGVSDAAAEVAVVGDAK